ncbi:MAG: saccharopine dehydrogenase NADP-binding domain-containing protein [Bacteroidetes bacterium]|nr:saccharopine dehydrogenase NADP-binding domain-containing protein [Bacteroidota bacterium]
MKFLIYGATGYTGKLMSEKAKELGLSPTLSGRNQDKLKQVAEPLGFDYEAVSLNDKNGLINLLNNFDLVIHTAGPFSGTAKPMVDACLKTKTHYLDITGEISVFERHKSLDSQAKEAGILIMSGVGFDVVPTDCLSVYMKKRMPDAEQLNISIGGLSKISAGTAKTAIENIAKSFIIRRNGKIIQLKKPLYSKADFGKGEVETVSVSWGDLATAYYSTGIPNIAVFFQLTTQTKKIIMMNRLLKWFLSLPPLQKKLKSMIEKKFKGPDKTERETAKAIIFAEAVNSMGEKVVSKLITPEGYKLTCITALEIANRVLNGNIKTGYFTPAELFGTDLITDIDGVELTDIM